MAVNSNIVLSLLVLATLILLNGGERDWYHDLSFLDVFPGCNVSESTLAKQNAVCFGASLTILAIIVIIFIAILCCCCCCCCGCCKRRRKGYRTIRPSEATENASSTKELWETELTTESMTYFHLIIYYNTSTDKVEELKIMDQMSSKCDTIGDLLCLTLAVNTYRSANIAIKERLREIIIKWLENASQLGNAERYPNNWRGVYNLLMDSKMSTLATQLNRAIQAPCSNLRRNLGRIEEPPCATQCSPNKRAEMGMMAANMEKEMAFEWSKYLFPNFDQCEELQDLGSRLQKYWFCRKNGQETTALQFTVKVSKKCPISLEDRDFQFLKETFKCLKHPHLLFIHDVAYEESFISVLLDFIESGSIRDHIFKADPFQDWIEKYGHSKRVKAFLPKNIATCTKQILGVVLMLYDLGFPALGQIHVGNVFVRDKKFVLGGYENVLLGYRTSLYSQIAREGWLDVIDVIMFGRMIYEMYTGEILSQDSVLLDKDHFSKVKDEDSNVREFLEYIFSEEVLKKKDPLREILNHKFVQNAEQTEKIELTCELTPGSRDLLQKISAKPSGEQTQISAGDLDIMAIAETLGDKYVDMEPCKIGWRPHKAWAKAKSKDHESGLLSAIKIPYTCPVFVKAGLDAMKSILKRKEKFLVRIFDLHYLKINDDHILVIFQEIFDDGSLKDKVYKISPWIEGGDKYECQGHRLPEKEIAAIGCQILNISLSLGFMDGLKSPLKLQFLHTGNIFERKDSIAIGGLENMILGCRPPNYMKFNDYVDCIDTLMFGHLIFELASGKKLTTTLPTDKDYKAVSSKKVKAALKTIFEEPSMNFKKILDLGFFSGHQTLDFKMQDPTVKLLLQHVRKGKRRDQDDTSDKIKYIAKKQLAKLKFRSIGKK